MAEDLQIRAWDLQLWVEDLRIWARDLQLGAEDLRIWARDLQLGAEDLQHAAGLLLLAEACFDDGAGCELASLTTCNVAEACCCCLRPAVAVVPVIFGLSWRSVVLLLEVLLKICCFLLRSAANACSCVVYWSAAMRLKINSWICCSLAEDWTWALIQVFHPVFMDRMVVFCKQMRFMENAYSSDMIQQNMQQLSAWLAQHRYMFLGCYYCGISERT